MNAVEGITKKEDRKVALKAALKELASLLKEYNRLPYTDGKSIIDSLDTK